MAGVKGRSGGARPNTGGPRPNSGRPPNRIDIPPEEDPVVFLQKVMNNPEASAALRVNAAKSLLPFVHKKVGALGKKAQKQDDAKKAAGRFAVAAAPPRLVAANGSKV